MRCINCGIAMVRVQRHVVSSLPMDLQKTLAQWISVNELPEDGHICKQCFVLLISSTPSERLLGHSMVCRGCGRSVRNIRHCIVESDSPFLQEFTFTLRLPETISNYICYPCWCRTKRHLRRKLSRTDPAQHSDNVQHKHAVIPAHTTDERPLDPLNCTETCHNVYDSHFIAIKHEVHSDTEVPEEKHETDCHEDTEVPEEKHECDCHEDTEVPEEKHECDCHEVPEVPEEKHECDCHEDPADVETDFSFEDVSPRQKSQERDSQPEPPNLPPSPVAQPTPTTDKITLPNYKRAPNTSSYCIFRGYCSNKSRLLIPKFIKRILLKDHNFYIPPKARVCESHLNANEWNDLPKNNSKFSSFTPRQIEDMIKLSKSTGEYMNFEYVDEMPNHVCQYWTGRTVSEFLSYLNTLHALNVPKRRTALAIYLAKLKTGETNRRLSTIFNIPRATLESMMKKVKTCLENNCV